MSKHVNILIARHNDQMTDDGLAIIEHGWTQCQTCGHLGYTTAPERPCALCDFIMQGDQDTLAEIGRMMRDHGYEPHQAAEELRQLATKGQ